MKKLSAFVIWLMMVASLLSGKSFACSKTKNTLDPNTTSTSLDGDSTGLIEACGNQPIVGFTYCRIAEGTDTQMPIVFMGPPSKCNQDTCVFIKVWNSQGQLVWGESIPKDKTRVSTDWKTLIGRDVFQVQDRGFFTWNMQVFYLNSDGHEASSTAQGDIVLRILRKEYLPLNWVENDSAYLWEWMDNGYSYKMTSGLRAFVKKGN